MQGRKNFTQDEANEIIALIKLKLQSDSTKQKGIRAKIRKRGFYASDFGFRDGYTVEDFLSVAIIDNSKIPDKKKADSEEEKSLSAIVERKSVSNPRNKSDENYVIDLCDTLLKVKALRQHRFDFLNGDSGRKLPVDAYYPKLNLVIEFKERQHTEVVKFFDRRQTVSGVGRGEQRKIYDQRRRDILPENGIALIELNYDEFGHFASKRLLRKTEKDIQVIEKKLKSFLPIGERK